MHTLPRLAAVFRRAPVEPIERSMRELERQGGGLVRVAHLFATLMIVLFSLGSLVALSGDAFDAIVATVRRGGVPGVPPAVSVAVSTLMVVCCDVGLVYAAMVLRALRTRGAASGYALHAVVLVSVSAIEAGTYLYMSARYEQPASWAAWALVVARAAAAPLLSVYLAMAAKLPITSRDILHQAELWQGIQLVRDVIAVAADPHAPLADKMELYEKSAVMTEADRRRLGEMIAVVKRRQSAQSVPSGSSRPRDARVEAGDEAVASAVLPPGLVRQAEPAGGLRSLDQEDERDDDDIHEGVAMPMTRYSARRLMQRLGAMRRASGPVPRLPRRQSLPLPQPPRLRPRPPRSRPPRWGRGNACSSTGRSPTPSSSPTGPIAGATRSALRRCSPPICAARSRWPSPRQTRGDGPSGPASTATRTPPRRCHNFSRYAQPSPARGCRASWRRAGAAGTSGCCCAGQCRPSSCATRCAPRWTSCVRTVWTCRPSSSSPTRRGPARWVTQCACR